jgi:hypothetical protein
MKPKHPQAILISIFTFVLINYLIFTFRWYVSTEKWLGQLAKNNATFVEPGDAYIAFRPFVSHAKNIGYFTDINFMPGETRTGDFQSAQYQLAPVVLDVGNQNHSLILLDYPTREMAQQKRQEIKADIIYQHSAGKLLVSHQ